MSAMAASSRSRVWSATLRPGLLLAGFLEELPAGMGHCANERRAGRLLMLRVTRHYSVEAAAHDLIADGVPPRHHRLVECPLSQQVTPLRIRRRVGEQLGRRLVRRAVRVIV